jgi:hypothetical protein
VLARPAHRDVSDGHGEEIGTGYALEGSVRSITAIGAPGSILLVNRNKGQRGAIF